MGKRPLPIVPKGPRRRAVRRETYLLACPRLSPEYELNAVQALMKPNERTKGKIEHVGGGQAWPAGGREVVEAVTREVTGRLGFVPKVHWAREGEFWFVMTVPAAEMEKAKGFAAALTKRLPGVWVTLGRVLVRDGRFWRRRYGYKLRLVAATNVHLRREIRGALKGLL